MRLGPPVSALVCLLAGGALLVACGSGGSDSTESTVGTVENRPPPPKSEFPAAEGRSLNEVLHLGQPTKTSVSPAATVFYPGENRYPFGVSKKGGAEITDAKVALYIAKVPTLHPTKGKLKKGETAQARIKALEEPAIGPFPARIESLAAKPAFRAEPTGDGLETATAVYLSRIDFPSDGEWRVAAVIDEDGALSAKLMPSALVGEFHRIPRPGQKAPLIHTPTAADVGGDLSRITTRVPPDTQNRVDYADALGREPIILLFATPQFCQSRVCGPVVDVAEQVKQLYGDKAAFIHMEIYKENDPAKGIRPQVAAFHLPSEPWLFAIDREGRVRNAIEGAFGVDELTQVVRGVTGE
jgi:hypothetical protein